MKKLLILLLMLGVVGICKTQEIQVGTTIKIQDVIGNPKVLEDGTTVFQMVDEIHATYLGKCELCGQDVSVTWPKSSGYIDPTKIFGCPFHPECFKKLMGYLSKKFKKIKQ